MILCNTEIHRAIDEKRLIIEPEPYPRLKSTTNDHCPYDTHSVDLRLANEIVVPSGGQYSYDLSKPGSIAETIKAHSTKEVITDDRPFNLAPSKFVLGKTVEWIGLPLPDNGSTSCLAARFEGKSSRARFGILVHFTAPTIHPGFSGTITLEIINLGRANILLVPNMYIGQLIIEEVRGVPSPNPSQFQGQASPEGVVVNRMP